jgi:hypothetical protein
MIPAGKAAVLVDGLHSITANTFAIAVCQRDGVSVMVRSAVLNAEAGTLTITLTRTAGEPMPVGWLLVN